MIEKSEISGNFAKVTLYRDEIDALLSLIHGRKAIDNPVLYLAETQLREAQEAFESVES